MPCRLAPESVARRSCTLVMALVFVAGSSIVTSTAWAQCAPVFPAPSATEPVDISFRTPDRARVITTGNFDGIGGTETGITSDGFPIIRVDTAVAGDVTVRGNADTFTYSFPAPGMYAVVFPFAPNGAGRTTFRITGASGPFSGGTGTWSANNANAPLTVVTAIDDGSEEGPCLGAEEPSSVLAAARLSTRLTLMEVGTWRQRDERALGSGRFTWTRVFGGGSSGAGSHFGLQAGVGQSFAWGRGSVFLSFAEASLSSGDENASSRHIGAGLTATLDGANESYIDLVARLASVTRTTTNSGGEASTSGFGYALSAEAGFPVQDFGVLRLQPEVQLILAGASLPAFALPEGGTATYDSGPAVFARAGLSVSPADGGSLWARIDLWSELQSGAAVSVDGGVADSSDALSGETWADVTLGFSQTEAARISGSLTARFAPDATRLSAEARLTVPF